MKRNRLCSTNLVVALMLITHSVHASVEMAVKPVGEKKVQGMQTRAVENNVTFGVNAVEFAPTAYSNNTLYLGASKQPAANTNAGNNLNAAQRAVTGATLQTNPNAVSLAPLALGDAGGATGPVTINTVPNQAALELNKVIALATTGANGNLVLSRNGLPLVRVYTPNAQGVIDGNKELVNADTLLANANKWFIGDATSVANAGIVGTPAAQIHTIAATQQAIPYKQNQVDPTTYKNFVFAAVSDNAVWGMANDANRGIASVMVADDHLIPLAGGNFTNAPDNNANTAANYAIELNRTPNAAANAKQSGPIASNNDFVINAANFGVNTWWDDKLQRLYVGLNNFANANNANDGAVGIMLGKMDTAASANGRLILNSLLSDASNSAGTALLTPDNTDQIVGMLAGGGGANQKGIFALNLRTLHTTSNKDYLVVNGGVQDGPTNPATWLFALPVMPNTNANPGTLAKIDFNAGTFAKAAVAGDLVAVDRTHSVAAGDFDPDTEVPYVIGADPRFISGDTSLQIQNIQVVGDTVYVSVAGDRSDANKEAGTFASTAILDPNGIIKAWTPWQRVAGVNAANAANKFIDPILGFGANTTNATTIYLNADQKTIASTAWGNSADVSAANRNLTDVIGANFPPSTQGAYHIANFDAYTPGFKTGEFSMTTVVGGQTVALVQMGQIGNAAGMENPTANFAANANEKVLVINKDPVIKLIAPAITAEVLRSGANAQQGLLYVGGGNGLAQGTAWNSDTAGGNGLNEIDSGNNGDYVGAPSKLGDDFAFTKIDEWDSRVIQALGGDGANMWVLAMDKLAKADGVTGASGNNYSEFDGQKYGIDMVIAGVPANPLAIVATTAGLFSTDDAKTFDQIAGIDTGFTPIHLEYLSMTRGVNSEQGNLLVLATNHDANEAKVYRFYVDAAAGTVTIVDSISLDEYRRWFAPNGAMYLASSNNTTGKAAQANLLGVTDIAAGSENGITDIINVDTTQFKYVGAPVRDTATGGWIVSGDFGVRVNE